MSKASTAARQTDLEEFTTGAAAKLSALRFGHDPEAGEDINSRVTDRGGDLDALAASLAAYGVIVPLIVVQRPKGLFVVDGNRRLAALRQLHAGTAMDQDIPIRVAHAPNGLALEMSLVTNLMRQDLHPVDQYEAFAAMKKRPEQIAKDFGWTTRSVEQALALGALSPAIRKAWRAGEISAEAAQAFTLAPEHKTQDRVVDKLRKSNTYIARSTVRHELKADATDASKFANLVGLEEYERQGGKLVRDLFEDRHAILNPDLAKQMADAKLAGICNDLVGQGWQWASLVADLPPGVLHSWQRISPKLKPTADERKTLAELHAALKAAEKKGGGNEDVDSLEEKIEAIDYAVHARSFTQPERARSGCIVSLVEPGIAEIHYGVIRPAEQAKPSEKTKGDKAADAKAAKKKDGPKDDSLPRALVHRLSQTLTKAAADVMREHTPLSVVHAALIAGFQTGGAATVCVAERGMGTKAAGVSFRKGPDFPGAFLAASKSKMGDQARALATICAAALDLQEHNGDLPLKDKGTAALIAQLGPGTMREALLRHFDVVDYFASANAGVVIAALKAMGITKLKSNKKADLAKIAGAEAKKQKWLPPELVLATAKPRKAAKRR